MDKTFNFTLYRSNVFAKDVFVKMYYIIKDRFVTECLNHKTLQSKTCAYPIQNDRMGVATFPSKSFKKELFKFSNVCFRKSMLSSLKYDFNPLSANITKWSNTQQIQTIQ